MNSRVTHDRKPATSPADWADVAELQKQLINAVAELEEMTPEVGKAKHILEYDSDRRKRALGAAMVPLLKRGESATAAESYARASKTYTDAMATIGEEHCDATSVVTKYEVARLKWETARSLLSMMKAQVNL